MADVESTFETAEGEVSALFTASSVASVVLVAGGEARLRIFRPTVIVPVEMGVFGFTGAGRVYVDGASPGGWHTSAGGGIWFTPLGQSNTLKAGLGVSEEATKFFVSLGLPY